MQKKNIWAICLIVALYAGLELVGVTCPIRLLTGISCAGCGMSRAWMSLLSGDIAAAFSYHPLFFLPIPVVVLLLFHRKLSRKLIRGVLVGAAVVGLLVYVVRLFQPGDTVVVFMPQQGLLPRIMGTLRRNI